jgi:alpha/beta superfamily hydrolase
MTKTQSVTIPGPVGAIEATLQMAEDSTTAALLSHPHPQYGGSMFDGVLAIAAEILANQGTSTLRFNFRGVGASDGQFDDGRGETDDLLAAAAWLQAELAPRSLSIVGYSFGASVAWRAVDRLPSVSGIVLIAPPVGMMDFPVRADLTCPVHAIAGSRDDFVNLDALATWAAAGGDVEVHEIEGADHFFGGYGEALGAALRASLGATGT